MMTTATAPLVAQLRDARGTYLLALHCARAVTIDVGARGALDCIAGWYLYVGSAHGAGGVRARLGRHLRGARACRWHVDYLHAVMVPAVAWVRYDTVRLEHAWAGACMAWPGLVAVPGVGCSDCGCVSHVFHARRLPEARTCVQVMMANGVAPPTQHLQVQQASPL